MQPAAADADYTRPQMKLVLCSSNFNVQAAHISHEGVELVSNINKACADERESVLRLLGGDKVTRKLGTQNDEEADERPKQTRFLSFAFDQKNVSVRAFSRDRDWCHIQRRVAHFEKEENTQHIVYCSIRSSCFSACLKKSASARSRKLGARNCWPEAKTGFSRSRKGNRKVSCALRSLVLSFAVSCHNLDSFCTEDVADHSAEVPHFEIGRENQNIATTLTQTQTSLCSVDQSLTRSQSLPQEATQPLEADVNEPLLVQHAETAARPAKDQPMSPPPNTLWNTPRASDRYPVNIFMSVCAVRHWLTSCLVILRNRSGGEAAQTFTASAEEQNMANWAKYDEQAAELISKADTSKAKLRHFSWHQVRAQPDTPIAFLSCDSQVEPSAHKHQARA